MPKPMPRIPIPITRATYQHPSQNFIFWDQSIDLPQYGTIAASQYFEHEYGFSVKVGIDPEDYAFYEKKGWGRRWENIVCRVVKRATDR